MNIPIYLDIVLPKGFDQKLGNEVRKYINNALANSIFDIQDRIGILFEKKFKSSKEYKAITSGKLHADLGLVDPIGDMEEIIYTIKENIIVSYQAINSTGTKGGITIKLIRSNYRDLLSLNVASYISVSKRGRYLIEWLNWLLTRGDDVIIENYIVSYGAYAASRSGKALMFRKNNGIYRIPPQYSGVAGDNMLTRAMEKSEPDIVRIFERSLRKYL